MPDNISIPATGSGDATPLVATDQDASAPNAHYQLFKLAWGPLNTFNLADVASGKPFPAQLRSSTGVDFVKAEDAASADGDFGIPALAIQKATPADTAGTDGDYAMPQMSGGKLWVSNVGFAATVSSSVTRPADTTAYAANDNWSDSTSAPTAGGFTFTGAGRISGGSGIITDMIVSSTAAPALMLQGEIWIYDSAATAVNDNAAFASVNADTLLLVAVIPFTLASVVTTTTVPSFAHIQNLNIGFTCVGTANLRYKIKVKNAYIPISAEVLTVRLKIIQAN